MSSNQADGNSNKLILTRELLDEALPKFNIATKTVHADDFSSTQKAIAPCMHRAANFQYHRDPEVLQPHENTDESHIYARYTAPNTTRFEKMLREIFGGHVVSYHCGLAAFPRHWYLGVQKLTLEELDRLEAGDIVQVETPLNPTGTARNLEYYAERAHAKGAYLTVDSTFAPPPLPNPLDQSADLVMHSGTKYIGGHSDMLCGLLVVPQHRVDEGWVETLIEDRRTYSSVMGNLESWLGLRSLRTFDLRVGKQPATATDLVAWISTELQKPDSVIARAIERVEHAKADIAQRLPSRLYIFQHATRFGGVESLMEWRAMSDEGRDAKVLRVSCGVEDVDDMKADILQGLEHFIRDFQ
ncbi:pyridoxal phosphate-dependent transferase [Aspergillus pseudotamarii]|uniref:Pyridoxal phosphate-dependent transferase n=1 Tax=Aspergillus pseudotamarii TaxID=132259 RepID=A0A5N6SWL2_ASPPS|nr:pyridoxal phosphate-dependent transferase [Aspergillus pseudotamarii]KAE8138189.1 pyridoxal phosphate-dependent transferase [Aspergillus pseudotamarii]